ncbi:hypothetical protein Tco_0416906 [Tanacetum coccineum]
MPIPAVMLNDDIKASTEYSGYLKKVEGGSTPLVKGGKGLLSKKGVKIAVEQLRIPKRRRSKTVTNEVNESEQMDDLDDFEETKEEEVVPLVGKDQLVLLLVTDKLVHKSSNEGVGVSPEVPDESDSSSSSSSSDSEVAIEDISSDEDEVSEKADNAKTVDAEKDTKVQVANKQPQKPEATLISSSHTLSSTEFTNQFINEPAEVNLSEILKDPVESKVQLMVDVPARMHEEPAVDEVINVDDHSQDDSAPCQDRSRWFKKSPRPDSPDPEWIKDPNADAGQEQDWFLELEKTAKGLEEFEDLLGTTFDFSNFVNHRLKKDKLTKADLEGDIIPQDLNKPLPFLGAPGRLYIPADYFFNKDLKYLRSASDEELEEPIEDQPLPADASPTAVSPGYIADSDLEEDPADYLADGGDNDDNESSDDDNNDDDVVKDEENEEEEEHLASADPSAKLIDDLVPSS